jgi:hypothetical protein
MDLIPQLYLNNTKCEEVAEVQVLREVVVHKIAAVDQRDILQITLAQAVVAHRNLGKPRFGELNPPQGGRFGGESNNRSQKLPAPDQGLTRKALLLCFQYNFGRGFTYYFKKKYPVNGYRARRRRIFFAIFLNSSFNSASFAVATYLPWRGA